MTAVAAPLTAPYWTEDPAVQAILDAIEAVRTGCQKLVDGMNDFAPTFYSICRKIMIFSGGTAGSLVGSCIAAYEGFRRLIVPLIQGIEDFIKNLRAPASIKALGDYLMKDPTNTAFDLKSSVAKTSLASTQSWSGTGAEAFFTVAKAHQDAFDNLYKTFQPIGSGIRDYGVAAQNQAIKVTASIGAGLIALIVGIAALTPPVTPAGVITCGASVTFIGVCIKTFADAVTDANNSFNAATKALVARYDAWPNGGGADKSNRTAMADGSVQDDAKDHTTPEWSRS